MASNPHPLELQPWQASFYAGNRLQAEVELLASGFLGTVESDQLHHGCDLIKQSYGVHTANSSVRSPFQEYQSALPEHQSSSEVIQQYLSAAECPDALLFWVLVRRLPSTGAVGDIRRLQFLAKTAQLLSRRFPNRPDLPFQLLMRDSTGSLLKSASKTVLHPSQWYSNTQAYLPQLQAAWAQGFYESMCQVSFELRLMAATSP